MLSEQCVACCEEVGVEQVDVEACVFLDAIEEADSCVVTGMDRETVECFCEDIRGLNLSGPHKQLLR